MQWRLLSVTLVVAVLGCQSAKKSPAVEKAPAAVQNQVEDSKDKSPTTSDSVPKNDVETVPEETQNPDCIEATDDVCAAEAEIVRLTNEVRRKHNVSGELALNPEIAYVSRSWSASMSKVLIINHFGFPFARKQVYKKKFGKSIDLTAENVAMGPPQSNDPKVVAAFFVDMWENSPGHLKNMLGNHQNLGVGLVRKGNGYWYATQIFN